jgi:hypothetical protein
LGPQILTQLDRLAVVVDTHIVKIGPKAGLHVGAGTVGQSVAAALAIGQAALDVASSFKAAITLARFHLKLFFFLQLLSLDNWGDGRRQRLHLKLFLFFLLALDQGLPSLARLHLKLFFFLLALDDASQGEGLHLKLFLLFLLALDDASQGEGLHLKILFLFVLALHQGQPNLPRLHLKLFLLLLALNEALPRLGRLHLKLLFLFILALNRLRTTNWDRAVHHLLCDPVSLLLVLIAHRSNCEFGLDQAVDSAIAHRALQRQDVVRSGL